MIRRLIVLLVALYFVPQTYAQLLELEVKSAPTSGTFPVFRDHPDDVAVIVNSSLTGLRFDSNVGIIADLSAPNDGVYRFIVRPWRQTITVSMTGYRQVRFTIPAAEPRTVLYYIIEPVKSDAVALIPVTIRVNQPDALVFIDAQQVDISRTIPLEVGMHQIRIEKNGYLTIDQPIEVSTESPFQEFTLQRLTQRRVVIRSTPPGARIRINGFERSEATPIDFFMFPGEYGLELSLPGHRTLTVSMNVQNGEGNEFNYTLSRNAGDLTLTLTPSNARVFIDEMEVDAQNAIPLSPGLHTIRAQAEGFETYQDTFEMIEGMPLAIPISLTPFTGSAMFTVRPIDTQITLYNSENEVVRQWTGSNLIDGLPFGVYLFTAQLQGYLDHTQQVVITRNEEQDVQFVFTNEMKADYLEISAEQPELAKAVDAWQASENEAQSIDLLQRAEQRKQNLRYRKGLQLSLFSGGLTNQNYNNNIDYTIGLGLGCYWDMPIFRVMVDLGSVLLIPKLDTPLHDQSAGNGVVGLYASAAAGPKINFGSSGFSVFAGVGYRTSAYYLLNNFDSSSQSLNSVFAEANVGWSGLQFFYRQGLQSVPEKQTLVEFGLIIR